MSRPNKRPAPSSEFQDPLSNYDPPKYGDPLEAALTEQPVAAIQLRPFTAVRPDLPIHAALDLFEERGIACLLVAERDRLVGVFTARDVLDKVAGSYPALRDRPVSEVMTRAPVFVYDTDSAAAALCVMAVNGFRHVPVLDTGDKIVGIVSPPRVTAFLKRHFARS